MNDTYPTLTGKVARVFVSESGKFGRVQVEKNTGRRLCKLDAKCFDTDIIQAIGKLKAGDNVEIQYELENECLKNKAGEDVIVDGYKVWQPSLTIKALNGVVPGVAEELPPAIGSIPF